jgi:hypothetical protein
MRQSMRVTTDFLAESIPVTLAPLSCNVCEHEIPGSEAVVAEAVDYVLYFCGYDCFQQWYRQRVVHSAGSRGRMDAAAILEATP